MTSVNPSCWHDLLPVAYDGTFDGYPWRLTVEMAKPPQAQEWTAYPLLNLESGPVCTGGGNPHTFNPDTAPHVETVRLGPAVVAIGGTCTRSTDQVFLTVGNDIVAARIVEAEQLPVKLFVAVVEGTPDVVTCWEGELSTGVKFGLDWT